MTLSAGDRLGPFEVLSPLGKGGMGEVYRARDTKLNRDVALKVLPATFASDRERLARFDREAQVLASLNHPAIAHIHGLEDSSGIRAIVMELVEGPTLADKLQRGNIGLATSLQIARQIAEALEAAHDKGIVHRDLKPANIKVSEDSTTVKVLDFGLASIAKSDGDASGSSEALTRMSGVTEAGLILGTPAYMSPEQARGQAVDKRTDIWAFGVVLFEMLSGQPAMAARQRQTFSQELFRAIPTGVGCRQTPQMLCDNCWRDVLKRIRCVACATSAKHALA
jgi:serine/threonine protein kinase